MRGEGLTSACILVLQICALVVFSLGFFQLRPAASPAEADHCTRLCRSPRSEATEKSESSRPVFDRMVFMLVDALRADFVYDVERFPRGFSWLRSVMDVAGVPTVAMAVAPTVTLPRLKALTAGTAPVFLDLLFNLDESTPSSALALDSWVWQLHQRHHPVLHYGDDTWLRLFPGMLHVDSEGTHSFFVTDTVHCDRNVTRHLDEALDRRDWQVLSLHYLGLDHVGHVGGIASPLMVPKMEEMDAVARRISEKMQARDEAEGRRTLMVVLGDHGMTNAGNHGGASPDETRTACIFLSPLYGDARRMAPPLDINQVDVAPTIAALLGLDTLRESTGRLISELIPLHVSTDARMLLLHQNALQLCHLAGDVGQDVLRDAVACYDDPTRSRHECCRLYETYVSLASQKLIGNAGSYNEPLLLAGCSLSVFAVFLVVLWRHPRFILAATLTVLSMQTLFATSRGGLLTMVVCVPIGLSLLLVPRRGPILGPSLRSLGKAYGTMVFTVLSYAFCMFASSFIEEEHEIWYFYFATFLLLDLLGRPISPRGAVEALILLVLFRSLRYWNSTGYLFRDEPDMKLWITMQSLKIQILYLVACLLLLWGLQLRHGSRSRSALALLCIALCIGYKGELLWSPLLQRFALLLHLVLVAVSHGDVPCLALFFIFLLKLHNAFPILVLALLIMRLPRHSTLATRVALVHASYFILGPCHLVASIDFSPAYIGQARFSPWVTGILGWITTWSGPLLSHSLLSRANAECQADLPWILWWRGVVHAAVLVCIALQRHHLFVWTVFAPRLLFEFGWTLFYLLFTLILHSRRSHHVGRSPDVLHSHHVMRSRHTRASCHHIAERETNNQDNV